MSLTLLAGLLIAFGASIALVLALRTPAWRLGLVDYPGGRKHHEAATPLIGGIAIFGAFVLAALATDVALRPYAALVTAMALLLACGVLDDLRELGGTTKLAFQIIAATLVVAWGGMVVTEVAALAPVGTLALGAWAVPLTLFGIVGLINAVNMLDGLDGLAGSASLAMLFWLAVAAHLNGFPDAQTLITVVAAALIGFLLFNARHPLRARASVFLGDAGSMTLGIVIAWFCIELAQAGAKAPVSPVAIGWIIALPVMDTVSLMLRRILKGRSPFIADHEHLHHLFIRAGYSTGQASWALAGIAFSLGGIGVLFSLYGVPDPLLAIGLLVAIGLHFVFIRYAWRTMKALRRLGERRERAASADTPTPSGPIFVPPVAGGRRRLALIGLYLTTAAIPLSTAITNIGVMFVLLATLLSASAFLRDMVRLPIFWIALGFTLYMGLISFLGVWQFPAAAEESVPHWRHVMRVTVLLSLPLAWWMASARFHWPWLFWTLIAASAATFAIEAHWPQLMRGHLGDANNYGSPAEYASIAACALVLLFAAAVTSIARLGRGWRPAFTLIISVAAAIPVLLMLVVSNYATAWIASAVGIAIVGAAAILHGANRRQWAGLIGGAALVATIGIGISALINDRVPTRQMFQQPLQAGALYLGGEPELARERHPATAERLALWSAALGAGTERPIAGWGVTFPRSTPSSATAETHDSFQNFYLSLFAGYGLLGLGLFLYLVFLLIRRLARATQRGLLPVGMAVSLYGVLGTMGTMLLLSTQIDNTSSRTLLILLFALLAALSIMRRWEREETRQARQVLDDEQDGRDFRRSKSSD